MTLVLVMEIKKVPANTGTKYCVPENVNQFLFYSDNSDVQ